jgi:hypothetical protein
MEAEDLPAGASGRDTQDSTGAKASRHPDKHVQLGIYIPESGAIDGGGKARYPSGGDKKGSTRPVTSMAWACTYGSQGRWTEAEKLRM